MILTKQKMEPVLKVRPAVQEGNPSVTCTSATAAESCRECNNVMDCAIWTDAKGVGVLRRCRGFLQVVELFMIQIAT